MRHRTPYALVTVGLVVGLGTVLSEPFPSTTLNYLVGGAFLAVAVAGVAVLITASSGPDERRPEF
jgi:uncharacterized membrane protein